jgi:hypothetical protein
MHVLRAMDLNRSDQSDPADRSDARQVSGLMGTRANSEE